MSETVTQFSGDSLINQLIAGRYRVKRRIGEGGMGTVYLAEHEAIEKKVALKILHREYSANREVVERFKQEAISASRIKHPNVIDVFDFGQLEDGSCFIAMELLEGKDLGDVLAQRGVLSPEQALRITIQITRALGLAHSRGVVHRDMKPENVFLQRTPESDQLVKIVDFGIAQLRTGEESDDGPSRRRRLTKTGMIFGTPEYMAPEQARGQTVDQRTDIYSVGIILYELLTGEVPFTGASFLEVLNQHVLDPLPPLDKKRPSLEISAELTQVVNVALERVLLAALAKSPEDRFPSMRHMAQALLDTPEGRALSLRLSAGGRSVEEVSDELVSHPPPKEAPEEVRRSAKTISGAPPPPDDFQTSTAIYGTRERTPGGLSAVAGHEKSRLPMWFGVATVLLVTAGLYAWFRFQPAGTSGADGRGADALGVAAAEDQPLDASSIDAGVGRPSSGDVSPQVEDQASGVAQPESESGEPSEARPSSQAAAADGASAERAAKAGQVTLHVETSPLGAIVEHEGFQVCDASPCDVSVERGAAVVLVARKGPLRGQAKVLAQQDQGVSIELYVPQPARPKVPTAQRAAPEKKLCEVMVGELKIARPCE